MPKRYKPILSEPDSVWREPAVEMARQLSANKETILENLGFYREHGRPEDFDGNFAEQVSTEEELVLSEIAGTLALAASVSATMSPGVLIATLRRILLEPTLIFQPTFPSEVAWILADAYQRDREVPGTFWPDIMGHGPRNFLSRRRKPTPKRIKVAASSALASLQKDRLRGRPTNVAITVLARKLGDLFRRYNGTITRHSLDGARSDGLPLQIDGGPFFNFATATLKPLQSYLRAADLPSVSASTVARLAVKEQNRKLTRETFGTLFHP